MSWMRRRWGWLILIASLAFNAGVGATFGVRAYRQVRGPDSGGGPGRCRLLDELNLTTDQTEQVEADRAEMMDVFHEVQRQLRQEHETLTELMTAAEPDREAIAEQIGNITLLHEQKHRRLVEHFLGIKELLDADQQEAFNQTVRRAICRPGHGRGGFGGRYGYRRGPGRGGRKGPFHNGNDESQRSDHEETE